MLPTFQSLRLGAPQHRTGCIPPVNGCSANSMLALQRLRVCTSLIPVASHTSRHAVLEPCSPLHHNHSPRAVHASSTTASTADSSAASDTPRAQTHMYTDVPPSVDAIMQTPKGTSWRVRPYNNADWGRVVDIQTNSFHQPSMLSILDKIAYSNFQAEVVDALRQKFKYSSPEVFQMLVVEAAAAPGHEDEEADLQDRSELGTSNQYAAWTSSTSATSTAERAVSNSATDTSASSPPVQAPQQQQQQQQQQAQQQRRDVLGVVEVSRVSAKDVLARLPPSTSEYVYISSMAVDWKLRRQGIAQALMQAAEMQARMWGKPHMTLHVHKDNAPAIALYRNFGYDVIGEDPGWKALVGDRVRVLMHKQLLLEQEQRASSVFEQ